MTSTAHYKPGSIIAKRYKVLQVLGAGGMGTVYRAVDQALEDSTLALKFLNPSLVQDKGIFTRFRREVLLARKLAHPNIVKVYDIGAAEEHQYFISMEFVAGRTLRDKIADSPNQRLALSEAMKILHEICLGIDHAHQSGIIHRDMKPDNILFDDTGAVKIADFGFAEATWKGSELTPVGETVGTPFYMAPEQIQGHPLDHRCDIYALGIIAYELLAGRRPFEEKSWFQLAKQHLQDPIPELPDSLIPPWYMEIVRKATEKKPDDRYRTAEEMAQALAAPQAAHANSMATQPVRMPDFSRYNKQDPTNFTFLFSAKQAMRRFSLKAFLLTVGIVVIVALLLAVIESNKAIHEQVTGTQSEIEKKLATLGKEEFDPRSSDAIAQLFSAVSAEDNNLIVALLEKGVDPNSRGLSGEYPMHVAARKGSASLLETLLQYAAAPSPQDENGATPLMIAIDGKKLAAFSILARYDQMINAKDRNGVTPLMKALASGEDGFVAEVLKRGGLVNDRDFTGTPVITYAVKSGNERSVRMVLDAGASTEVKDFQGKSPRDYTQDPSLLAILGGVK